MRGIWLNLLSNTIIIVCFFQLGQTDRLPYNLVNIFMMYSFLLYISNQREENLVQNVIYNSNKYIIKD